MDIQYEQDDADLVLYRETDTNVWSECSATTGLVCSLHPDRPRLTPLGSIPRACSGERELSKCHPVPGPPLRRWSLRLSVSGDEEHVRLQLSHGGLALDFGAREHNYLLLTLARRRIADARAQLRATSCGWMYVDELAKDPSMAPPKLNIDVHRIRNQLRGRGISEAETIIERRRGSKQIRLGVEDISIVAL